MPADAPRQQLARVAAVTDDLDRLLDRLFQNVAELKVILAGAEPDPPGPGQEAQ